jgi:hypothetical protein
MQGKSIKFLAITSLWKQGATFFYAYRLARWSHTKLTASLAGDEVYDLEIKFVA